MSKRKADSITRCSTKDCANEPLYEYDDGIETCENHKKHKLITHKILKVAIEADAIDLLTIQQWDSWCDADKCKQCGAGCFSTTYEVNWKIRFNNEAKYCSEMCYSCLKNLSKLDPDIQSEEYRKNNKQCANVCAKYGL